MTEALSHAEGKEVAGLRLTSVDLSDVDAKVIRQKLHLTHDEMVEFLGTSTSGAARTLLPRVMEREPEAVLRALAN
jgi:putative transcriptional regulator